MSETLNLANAVASTKGEKGRVTNIKFFLGEDREISQVDLLKEAVKCLHQFDSGLAQEKKLIDSHIQTTNISQFI